jgi:hypothetical protein
MILVPPSGRRSAAPPHDTPTLICSQVHVAGQSELVAQVVAFGVQCFVVDGVQVQSGGGGSGVGAGAVEGGSGAGVGGVDGGTGLATPASTPAEPLPVLPGVAVPDPATPVPAEPAQPQASGSGTQENPSPQLASVVHGRA